MRFDLATAVSPLPGSDSGSGPGSYSGAIHPSWDIRGNANGGYLVAMAARAMSDRLGRPDPATITAHFLSPGLVGPVEVSTEIVKEGRMFGTATATMRPVAPADAVDASGSAPAPRPIIQVLGAFTDLSDSGAPELVDAAPPVLPPVEECVELTDDAGFSPELFKQIELRMHPDDAYFHVKPSGQALMRGWFRLLDDEPMDTIALLLATDALPPTVFNADLPVSWVPTVELTVHLRSRPVPGWLRCEFRTRFVTGGFLEEDGLVWDESGRLVAQSRQLALLPKI